MTRVSTFFTVFSGLQNPTLSFINRPSQAAYRRDGVHELVSGPRLSIVRDPGLPQVPVEAEFYIVDLEMS